MNATPDDVIQIVREEFGEENCSVKKLLTVPSKTPNPF